MEKTYRIADCNIRICSLWDRVHQMCRDYLVSEKADFCICVNQADIEREREESICAAKKEGRPVRPWSDAYLETLAVYRQIAEKMLSYDTLLFHGSAIAVDGVGYLFIAPSGTGKSTHTRLWREMLGERAVMINDDKPLLRVTDHDVVIYGTPWNGKHRLGNNISVPLCAVCILDRATENSIVEISAKDAVTHLLMQCYRPSESEGMQKTLMLLNQIAGRVLFYHLWCNMDTEAARISWQAMCPADAKSGD